jgi:hypothetical protein
MVTRGLGREPSCIGISRRTADAQSATIGAIDQGEAMKSSAVPLRAAAPGTHQAIGAEPHRRGLPAHPAHGPGYAAEHRPASS